MMTESGSQDPVVRFLSDPSAYPAPVASVEIISTHASIIFLAGERAYKLKRAIRYSYLDYSTPEQRRKWCARELALNRRTAPGLYLSVLPVCREDTGQLNLAGHGAPLDWLVEMRRFPQEALFSAIAEKQLLSDDLAVALTGRIASFHATALKTPSRGGVAGIKSVIAINDENLRRYRFSDLDLGEIDHLRHAWDAALEAHALLLERRRNQGMVRHCHGDLHLSNICLLDGQPTLFDCIEFSDAIACIDVLYDLAFLLMDLRARGLGRLCALISNRYVDLTGDEEGVLALPLFMSLRAGVRAHVTAASAGRAPDSALAMPQMSKARSYFNLAAALLQPRTPRLVAIGGLSGTGKSTVAAAIAGDLGIGAGARVLRSDVLRKRLFGQPPEFKLPREAYDSSTNQRVYADIATKARRLLAAGHSVVIDAVSARPDERAALKELASEARAEFTGIWLEASKNILVDRLNARHSDASDATSDVLQQQLTYELGPIDWVRLDANRPIAAVAQDIRDLVAD